MDLLTILGVIIGFAALIGGNWLEGGSWTSLLNGPAAIIVIGGTVGAALLQTPRNRLRRSLSMLPWILKAPATPYHTGVKQVVRWAAAARKEGLLGLEALSESERNPFARKGLQLLVDGSEPEDIRRVLENDLDILESRDIDAVRFFESMGGYAPTIGILGAVMGLISVMQNLADPSQLGPGIAVAFVATIYGVALANLLLIPVANKLSQCVLEQSRYRELMLEGIVAIAEGENPKAIEMKLNGYTQQA
ncbi:flagellar motor protein [Simiduia agarivorans]|uniref:Flagellar motor protein n=1 Tax=Simiduia agarivorans (strain DSM 21679 / JCM 13881 / BCRC 17597 / SA1) TaxID=1117647 RepID=K4KFK8_SIMAS|nr:flagellar motor protein [Simiduia agarivorans]AFU97711.1 flagellar motor protein [Simiduia agarivorans SA1 = DSM 21679]